MHTAAFAAAGASPAAAAAGAFAVFSVPVHTVDRSCHHQDQNQ